VKRSPAGDGGGPRNAASVAEHTPFHEQADLYKVRSGARLRRARERAGLSGHALARLTGLNPSIIMRYEGGIEPPPDRRCLLAHHLGVAPDDIWHFHEGAGMTRTDRCPAGGLVEVGQGYLDPPDRWEVRCSVCEVVAVVTDGYGHAVEVARAHVAGEPTGP
jgi:transcriptional regulator with XRE-family HTH domain